MITVSILINGQPIVAKNAINQGVKRDGFIEYKTDSGEIILHKPEDGARYLAHMLLDTIRNDDSKVYNKPSTVNARPDTTTLEQAKQLIFQLGNCKTGLCGECYENANTFLKAHPRAHPEKASKV